MRDWIKTFFVRRQKQAVPVSPFANAQETVLKPTLVKGSPPNSILPPEPPPANMALKKHRFSVGSGPHNDIVLPDKQLSRTHMYIAQGDDGQIKIIDTFTPNGVWISKDGTFQRIDREALVSADDVIRLGTTEMTVAKMLRLSDDHVDIFISYAREDEAAATELDSALVAHGWKPWRDNRIGVARQYDSVIEERLRSARCVVVLWSHHSVKSQWVITEASFGFDKNVLVPVFLETVETPLIFRRTQGCFLTGTTAEQRAEQLHLLFAKLEQLVGRPA